jgi:hypothetical protein
MRFKVAKRSFTLMLRCEYPSACPAQPQPPPPGIPNVAGDWSIHETTADTDCSPTVTQFLRPPGSVRFSQDGVGLHACIDPEDDARGDRSPLGQGIVSASTIEMSAGYSLVGYVYQPNLVTSPPTNDTMTATEQWSILQATPPMAPVCTRTATATMSRRPMAPCTGDDECIAMDPCMRCDRSVLRCALLPLCQ